MTYITYFILFNVVHNGYNSYVFSTFGCARLVIHRLSLYISKALQIDYDYGNHGNHGSELITIMVTMATIIVYVKLTSNAPRMCYNPSTFFGYGHIIDISYVATLTCKELASFYFFLLFKITPQGEWADPGGTARPGQPVAKVEQAPDTSPKSKNQFNIVVPQWGTYQILS